MNLKLKLKGQIMYCQNFGVATDANRSAGSLARPTKVENRRVPNYESVATVFPSVSASRPVLEAAVLPAVEVSNSPHAAVSTEASDNSDEARNKARTKDLKETAKGAAMFCVVTAVATMIFVPTAMETRLIGSAIWLAIAFGIFMMSRTAAIIGLVLIAINIVASVALIVTFPHPAELNFKAIYLIGAFYFWWTNAVYAAMRGSFEYHRSLRSL